MLLLLPVAMGYLGAFGKGFEIQARLALKKIDYEGRVIQVHKIREYIIPKPLSIVDNYGAGGYN